MVSPVAEAFLRAELDSLLFTDTVCWWKSAY
jgi:hypothetical protein